MADNTNIIMSGDCLEIVPQLPRATMIFADPPDNLRMRYDGYIDYRSDYAAWLAKVVAAAAEHSSIAWLSVYHKHLLNAWMAVPEFNVSVRLFVWRFTFGQHSHTDCASGFRPILRIMQQGAIIYPDAIREQSQRQRNGDKRADPRGRVPDDVLEFPRVCGTFHERRKWHPNQHPEALIERLIKFSCKPGDSVIDMFAGTGTVNRVCRRLGVNCIGIEKSSFYCQKICEEMADRKADDGR